MGHSSELMLPEDRQANAFIHHFLPSLVNICFVLPKEVRIPARHNDIHLQENRHVCFSYVDIYWRHCGLLIKMGTLDRGLTVQAQTWW